MDGAAAVVVKSASRAEADGDEPLSRIVSWGVVGLEPSIMAYGPVPSSLKAIEKAGLTVSDIDLWEINEAFAGRQWPVSRISGYPMTSSMSTAVPWASVIRLQLLVPDLSSRYPTNSKKRVLGTGWQQPVSVVDKESQS